MRGTDPAALRARFPGLADRIAEAGDGPPELALETAASGEPTLRAAGALAHSARDPRREARKLAELSRGEGPLVLLGLGLGYTAEAALELDPERALVIVDKDPAALALAFRARDLSALIDRDRTAFVVGGPSDGVLAALAAFGGAPSVLSNRAVRALDEAWYGDVERAVKTWADKDKVNAATLARFGKRWVRNLAANLDSIRDRPGIARLAGCAAGLPTLVVAAGPSLDEVLPSLRDLSRRCVIVAVDTALRAVLAAGVEPDFTLVVDPQFWNARHLDRCRSPRTVLVTESAVYPSVLRPSGGIAARRIFLCASHYPLGRFVEDRVDGKGMLGAGGSVATTAWDFARFLGASPLWIAGLDLAFPGLKTHFKGALFEERAHGDSRRFDPVELRSFKALRDGGPFRAADASGGAVLTDKRLSLYAAWFESRFRQHAEERPRSLSPRGLRIAGLTVGTAEEILALEERRQEIEARIETALAEAERGFRAPAARAEREARYRATVEGLRLGLADLAELARDAAAECAAALEALEGAAPGGEERIAAALALLDSVSAAVSRSAVKDVAGFLFPPLASLEAELPPAGDDKLKRHLELSRLLYARLAESAEYHGAALALAKKQ